MGPAGTPLEAMHRMISTKKLSSKINYSVLDNLFDQLRPGPPAAAAAAAAAAWVQARLPGAVQGSGGTSRPDSRACLGGLRGLAD